MEKYRVLFQKKTSYVIAGDKMGPSKRTKAESLEVPIISEDDFIEMIKMNNKTKKITLLFFTVSFLDIIGVATNISWLQIIFKPLIIPSLIALYYYSANKVNKWYVFALLFSFLGDVLLMDKVNYFIFGIGAFLITQVLFIKIISSRLKKSTITQKTLSILPFLLFYTILIYVLKDNLNELFYPVAFYGFTISVFGMVALLNHLVSKNSLSKYLLIGAVIFIASDSMIALHKFHEPKMFYPIAIMLTYVFAQYLIYKFMVKVDTHHV